MAKLSFKNKHVDIQGAGGVSLEGDANHVGSHLRRSTQPFGVFIEADPDRHAAGKPCRYLLLGDPARNTHPKDFFGYPCHAHGLESEMG
ncbi:hypothetical protein D3C85_1330510 [compost metagenome]